MKMSIPSVRSHIRFVQQCLQSLLLFFGLSRSATLTVAALPVYKKLPGAKRFSAGLLVASLFLAGTSFAQTAASSTWALTANANAAVTGSVTGTAAAIGSGINSAAYSANNGITTGSWSNDAGSLVSNEYYEYEVTPTSGNALTVTSVTLNHSVSSGNWLGAVYYSLDGFATAGIQLGANFTSASVSPTQTAFSSTGLSILVGAGSSFSVRVYGWESDGNFRSFRNRNVVISGTTCPIQVISTQPATQTLCVGATLNLSVVATNSTSYQWKKGGVDISGANSSAYTKTNISAGDAGSYTVVASSSCANITSNAATITVSPTSVGGSVAGGTNVCTGTNSTTLTLSGHTGTVTRWESSLDNFATAGTPIVNTTTTLTATNLSATTSYRAVVTSGVCAAANSASATVTVVALPVGGSVTGGVAVCTGTNSTALTLSGHTGTIVRWESSLNNFSTAGTPIVNTTTSFTATNLTATTSYRAVITNGSCNVNSASTTVTVNPAPTAAAGGTQTICQTGTATVSGASAANGTILWTHNGTGSITSGATTTAPVYTAAAGDAGNTVILTMTVTSNNACAPATATATYSVVVRALPTASAGGSQTICRNATATVSGATSSNGTIAWTENGAGTISAGGTTLTPTYTPGAADAGNTVTLTMTVSNSPCTAATATYSVIVNPLPTATAGGTQTICQTGTATVSGASAANGTILWTDNGTGSITAGATTLTPTYTAAAGDAGNTVTLTMTVTSNNVCAPATATATYSVVVRGTPTASAGGSQTICPLGTATVSGATSSNGTISWTDNGAGSITAGSTTLTPTYTSAAGDAGNTVTLTMTVSNSPCVAATATYSVIVSPAAPAAVGTITGSTTVCEGATSINYTVAAVTNATNYTWTVPTGWSITSGQGSNSLFVTAGSGGQNGDITVIASNSCGSNNPSSVVNIFPVNATNNTGYTTTTTKTSGDIQSNSLTLRGYVKFPLSAIPSGAVITSSTLTFVNNGSATLSGANNDIKPLGNNDPVSTAASALYNAIGAQAAGTNYSSTTWSNTGTVLLTLNSTATADIQSRFTSPGYIAMGLARGGTATYIFNGFAGGANAPKLAVTYTAPRALAVNVNSLPAITVQPSTPAATCAGSGTQTINVTATGTGVTYSWRKDGTPVSNGGAISGQGTSTLTLTSPGTSNAGSYDVVVSGTCTPPVTSDAVTVTVNTAPSISAGPTTPAATCSGSGIQTLSVTATGTGLTYNWRKAGVAVVNSAVFSGQGTATLTLTNPTTSDAGNYDVVVSGTCSPSITSGAVPVSINTAPSITTQPVTPAATCTGSGTQSISVAATGTGLSYSWRLGGVPVTNGGAVSGQGTNTLTLTNPTAANAGSYDVVVSGICSPDDISNAVTVTVNPATIITVDAAPASQTVYINDPSPNNLTVTATGTGLVTYQWFSNTSNSNSGGTSVGAGNGGQTNTYTPPTNTLGTVYYYAEATGTCGTAVSSAVAVTITNTNTWKQGNPTNDWNTASNWAGGSVPTGANDAAIPVGNTPYPVLSASTAISNLVIDPGATVGIGGNTLTINGAVTGTGTISGSATSSLVTNATTTVRFTGGANSLKNLTVNAGTTTLANALDITAGTAANTFGTVTVANGATLASNGNLNIKSNQFGTARVATNTSGVNYITGDVTVERYIPQNASKAWRLLSVPTKGTKTIKQTWQENQAAGVNGLPGFGTQITGNLATLPIIQAAGFDAFSQTPSAMSYNSGAQAWNYLTSTNAAPIETNKGYFLYVRGSRAVSGSNSTAPVDATVLRTTGTLYQGDNNAAVAVAAGKFEPVGNTYASAIDFTSLSRTGTLSNNYYIWDAKLVSGNQLGAYQTFVGALGYTPVTNGGSYPSGVPNTTIESGSAIMLGAPANGGGTIKMVEAAKTTGNQFNPFRPASLPAQFKTTLMKVNGAAIAYADNAIGVFDQAFSNSVDGDDATRFPHAGETLSLLRDGQELIVEARQPVTTNDTLFFVMKGMQPQQQYKLEFSNSNLPITGLSAFVEDKFLNTVTPINLASAIHTHNFSVDATAASAALDRFRIVFRQIGAGPVPVNFISVSANRGTNGIAVTWTVAAERSIRSYEVERSADGRTFNAAGTVSANGQQTYNWLDATAAGTVTYYRIKSIGAAGDVKYSTVVKVTVGNVKPAITISPNPVEGSVVNLQFKNQPKGRYNIRLMSNAGQLIYTAAAAHAGGTSTQVLNLPTEVARGAYQLEITAPDNTKQTQTLFINSTK